MDRLLPNADSREDFVSRRRFLQFISYSGGMAIVGCSQEAQPEQETSAERYPHHNVRATVFWLGEAASGDNAGIPNVATEWDSNALERFGGIDDPDRRNKDGLPSDFSPLHNPCYVALPASEFNESGLISGAREASPWREESRKLGEGMSLFKGRWVKITHPDTGDTAFGQWIDTGPSDNPEGTYDYDYVFGTDPPENTFGENAGIDLSPTLAHLLKLQGAGDVTWQFVDEADVPDGPWRQFSPVDNRTHY